LEARGTHYLNEFDPGAAMWLRELIKDGHIPGGKIDERSIKAVAPDDVRRFGTCHWFAGIGGWPLALRLAGWPDDRPVWTGSCPCQPYSSAGKGLGDADPRNLWPDLFRLIRACRPPVVFGEQVASSDVVGTELEAAFITAVQGGKYDRANKLADRIAKRHDGESLEELALRWIDRVRSDVERESYTFWFSVLGAHSAGADHIRLRVFWVAHTDCDRTKGEQRKEGGARRPCGIESGGCGPDGTVADRTSGGQRLGLKRQQGDREESPDGGGVGDTAREHSRIAAQVDVQEAQERGATKPGDDGGKCAGVALGDAGTPGLSDAEREELRGPRGRGQGGTAPEPGPAFWASAVPILCRDGKYRRVPIEPALFPLVDGLQDRVGLLRGSGNAIVPQVAAAFIKAFLEFEEGR